MTACAIGLSSSRPLKKPIKIRSCWLIAFGAQLSKHEQRKSAVLRQAQDERISAAPTFPAAC
jgi:hypothetical protein